MTGLAVQSAEGMTDSWQLPAKGYAVLSFELTLLLVGCVTKPVQLAKQAEPNLTAVVCYCVKLALEGPSESCC